MLQMLARATVVIPRLPTVAQTSKEVKRKGKGRKKEKETTMEMEMLRKSNGRRCLHAH